MRINQLNSFSVITNRRIMASEPTQTQTTSQSPDQNSAPSFKGSSLGGGVVGVAQQVATAGLGFIAAFMGVLLGLGAALTVKANDDVREGNYDLSDIYGDRGELDRTLM